MQSPVALITGGSRGIGAATAKALAEKGYDVCISYRQAENDANSVVEQIRALGQHALAVQANVANEADVTAIFERCNQQLGTPNTVINSAGIVADAEPLHEISLARFERLFSVNVTGTFLCCKAAVSCMSTRLGGSGGSIINVSSVASRLGSPGEYVDYAATKAAVDTLTLGLAREVATEGIRVNAVRPGIIDTEIHASGGQPDRAKRLAPQIPMQRAGDVDEVARTIVWLASDEASYVTGTCVDVAGGR